MKAFIDWIISVWRTFKDYACKMIRAVKHVLQQINFYLRRKENMQENEKRTKRARTTKVFETHKGEKFAIIFARPKLFTGDDAVAAYCDVICSICNSMHRETESTVVDLLLSDIHDLAYRLAEDITLVKEDKNNG